MGVQPSVGGESPRGHCSITGSVAADSGWTCPVAALNSVGPSAHWPRLPPTLEGPAQPVASGKSAPQDCTVGLANEPRQALGPHNRRQQPMGKAAARVHDLIKPTLPPPPRCSLETLSGSKPKPFINSSGCPEHHHPPTDRFDDDGRDRPSTPRPITARTSSPRSASLFFTTCDQAALSQHGPESLHFRHPAVRRHHHAPQRESPRRLPEPLW